jgi:hypothetical protein
MKNKHILLLCALVLTGCAGAVPKKTQVTQKTSDDLSSLGSTLSKAEGKAVILRTWLEAHQGE